MASSRKFAFADLFCGIGGMRLGLEQAGGRCVYSSEINKYAVETYMENFGDVPAGDITITDAKDVPDHDVLAAGFPCQPFSLAGISKRNSLNRPSGFSGQDGTLFNDIVRVLKAKRPQAFLLENVKNLKSIGSGRTFRRMVRDLEGCGYTVKHAVLDARAVVPQHRERLFIVGFGHDADFEFPDIRGRNPPLREILEPDYDPKYVLTDGVWAALRRHKAASMARGSGFGYGIADQDGASRTMSRRYYKDGAEILIARGRGRNPRRLTPRECARLMGFGDGFAIPVSDTQAYRQFGNSVVPGVVAQIGARMVECLYREQVIVARRRHLMNRQANR